MDLDFVIDKPAVSPDTGLTYLFPFMLLFVVAFAVVGGIAITITGLQRCVDNETSAGTVEENDYENMEFVGEMV